MDLPFFMTRDGLVQISFRVLFRVLIGYGAFSMLGFHISSGMHIITVLHTPLILFTSLFGAATSACLFVKHWFTYGA
jgi:hypothetical protein